MVKMIPASSGKNLFSVAIHYLVQRMSPKCSNPYGQSSYDKGDQKFHIRYIVLELPIYGYLATFYKIFVGIIKMIISLKSISRERGRVGTLQDQMTVLIDQAPFLTRKITPQKKNQTLALFGELLNDRIGKMFPPRFCMRPGSSGLHGQDSIE